MTRLGRRLRREAKAHPKRAAVLGLLGLVAVWFWGPLAWGWVTPTKAPAPAAAAETPTASGAAAPPVDEGKPKTLEYAWDELLQWIQADPRTTAQAQLPGRPNPFHSAESEAAKTERQKEEAQKLAEVQVPPPPPDPASLGVILSSTIVGPDRRVALVNGRAYRLGDEVTLTGKEQSAVFRLVDISPEGIVLERDGKRFDVSLPKPKASGRIEVAAATTKETP